jgi:hypothetical protein
MKIRKIATAAALTLAATTGFSTATLAAATTAQASSTCTARYGNSVLTGTFTWSNRNVSVAWVISAASGSGNKRARLHAWNRVESIDPVLGALVPEGTRRSGTLAGEASQLAGGYGQAQLFLLDNWGDPVANIRADRQGCTVS